MRWASSSPAHDETGGPYKPLHSPCHCAYLSHRAADLRDGAECSWMPVDNHIERAKRSVNKCYGGDSLLQWAAPDPRRLSNRFSNCSESEKGSGVEKGWEDVHSGVREVWRECVAALKALTTHCTILPSSVVFLVLYSPSQHATGNSRCLYGIAEEVQRIIYAPRNFSLFGHILRVIVISVGLHHHTAVGAEPPDRISYPSAGVYTFQAVLRAVSALPSGDENGVKCALSRDVIVLSDAWLHPRSAASFLGSAESRRVAVFPAVVSASMSPMDICYCARYAAARCARVDS